MSEEQTEYETIYGAAVKNYGFDAQIDKLLEEMSELSAAILRRRHGRTDKCDVEEEIADVSIMLKQMAYIYDERRISQWIDVKTTRLEERMHNG